MIEQMFSSDQLQTDQDHRMNRVDSTQPERAPARLIGVIADPTLHPRRTVAFDLALRVVTIALVTLVILGILPAIAEAAA
jgi:hypothetical protein